MFGINKSKRIVNEEGLVKCSTCGEYKTADCFQDRRNQCTDCLYERQKEFKKNDLKNRVNSARQSQDKRVGLTKYDDLTVEDVQEKLIEQNYCCSGSICGHKHFDEVSDFEIGHIISAKNGGNLTKWNIQLLCHACNSALGSDDGEYVTLIFETVK